jgi:hypothetical protein
VPRSAALAVSAYAFSAGISGVLAAGFADRFDRKTTVAPFLRRIYGRHDALRAGGVQGRSRCGAWSRPLARQVSDEVSLDSERGYHLEFAMDVSPITRPVSPIDLGFYITPMAGRLRVAGTVELGGLSGH